MFHAFRCVFDCWNFCADRFGLGWTHNAISFSMSHVHAFSCIRTLYFLSICSRLWLCSVFSLSVSLSLSLSNRLHMAPMHKSTLVRNPFHSRSSSPIDLPPLHVRFCNDKAHQDFSENFSKRGIHPEHHVILSDFADTTLVDVIHTWGWKSLCVIPLRCPIVIIQEFYSNMYGIDTSMPQFATHIRGTCIVVTSDLVFKILHILQVAHPDYTWRWHLFSIHCLTITPLQSLVLNFCYPS